MVVENSNMSNTPYHKTLSILQYRGSFNTALEYMCLEEGGLVVKGGGGGGGGLWHSTTSPFQVPEQC